MKLKALAVAALVAGGASTVAVDTALAGPADTLRVASYSRAPARGNPFLPAYAPSIFYFAAIYDTLTRVAPDGSLQPWIASSWKSVDPTTWQFTIRPGVEFSNGEKLDAATVVATYNWLLTEGKATSAGRDLALVDSVRLVDANTVEIKTKAPDPLLAAKQVTIYHAAPKAWKDMGVEAYTAKPVTSGPFMVENWNDTEARFVAFPKSWRPAKVQKLTITELAEQATRVQGLLSDQTDLALNLPTDAVARINSAGARAEVLPGIAIMSLALFTTDFQKKYGDRGSPFRDVRVRRAVNLAINREELARDLMKGLTEPASQPADRNTFGYNPNVKPYPYDPARAKQLLAEAGYPNGFDVIGEVTVGSAANDSEIYQYVADAWTKIGLKVDLRPIPFPDWTKKRTSGTWEGAFTSIGYRLAPVKDPIRPYDFFSCKHQPAFFCDEAQMPLVTAAETEMDPAKREQALKTLIQRGHDDAIAVPILTTVDVYGVAKRVKNFSINNLAIRYEDMALSE